MTVKALILCGDGINCEEETAFAFRQASAEADIVHINALIETPTLLKNYQIMALPGGFSFGDEINSGKILAIKLQHTLGNIFQEFIEKDNLVIGICNGFQALVKMGLLPVSKIGKQQVTLAHNRQKRFINRWISLKVPEASRFFEGLETLDLPMRHGEGRIMVPQGQEDAMTVALQPHIAATYTEDVNGSFMQIAALVNEKGNVLGIMPHPEAFIRWTQHPAWTSMSEEEKSAITPGLQVFRNMVKTIR